MKKIAVTVSVLLATFATSIFAENTNKSNGIYQIKSDFIEKISKSAIIHSREAELQRKNLTEIIEKIKNGENVSKSDDVFINNLSNKMHVEPDDFESLALMTDKVPTSIIISVAIVESNWGTDDLSKKSHNPYNLRCFKIGCGLVDKASKSEIYSELSVFKSLTDATRAFARNINMNSQYSKFRKSRSKMRENGEYLTSLPLAEFISEFSGNEDGYGKELRKIIHENKLYYLDQ